MLPRLISVSEYKQRALGEFDVTLHRKQAGFGFRILSGDVTNPKVTIGNIVEGNIIIIYFNRAYNIFE